MNLFSYITDAGVLVLTGFLAFSGWLAEGVHTVLGSAPEYSSHVAMDNASVQSQEEDTADMEALSSEFPIDDKTVPDILLENPAFQQAAAIESLSEPAPEPIVPDLPLEERIENAIVNILCIMRTEEKIRTITGSGVFITPTGIILTNAHVAQFLLLETISDSDRDTRCIIRTGQTTTAQYEAELLYIPPMWVQEHAELIDIKNPTGTGERDYALLYASSALEGELPETFPFLPPDVSLLTQDTRDKDVFVAGYPAPEQISTIRPDITLSQVISSSTINRLFTFNTGYADLFAVGDSEASGDGISGGPIVHKDGTVIGLVVTKGDPERDGERSLRAITLSYIDRTIKEETGFSLSSTTVGNLAFRSQIFKEVLTPFLANTLDREFD